MLARCSSTQPQLHFTCRFSAYTWTSALVLSQSRLICMYALFICLRSASTIENKLTFLGFIFVFSKPAEKNLEAHPGGQAILTGCQSSAVTPPPLSFSPVHSSPPLLSLSYPFSPSRLRNSPNSPPFAPRAPPPSLTLSFIGRLSSLSEADTSFVKGDSHSFSRLLHAALCFMLRHVGCLPPSIYFNYVLIARRPLLNACLLFLSGRCEKLAVDCDFLHYLN